MKRNIVTILLLLTATIVMAKNEWGNILNGVPLFDSDGHVVNAHGACIVKDGGRYYLFGEYKSDTSNAFPGFSCYSSDDLAGWKFERMALTLQQDGLMGPERVGERVKVMRCPKTGEYVMFMHSDNLKYTDQYTAYATSKTINGEYTFQGPVLFNGQPLRYWDMGTFQDEDGTGYLLENHGDIYRLSDDYHSAVEKLTNVKNNCQDNPEADLAGVNTVGESPAMFKHEGTYYLLYSNTTSWEKNDNFYLTATSIRGPWTRQGLFCPKGTLTYNSQTTFVLPLGGGRFMYMGDRWSYPHQASAATYVWLPFQIESGRISIPEYLPAWNSKTGERQQPTAGWEPAKLQTAGDTIRSRFYGTQFVVIGSTLPTGCYAEVRVSKNGQEVSSSVIDFYSKTPEYDGMRYISPVLEPAEYTVEVINLHDRPNWTDKKKNIYGSTGYDIMVSAVNYNR